MVNLSLEEKVSLLSGAGFWHTKSLNGKIKHLELSDGPHGLRKQPENNLANETEPAICYPTASALACTFDPGIVGRIGDELGKEAKEKGVTVLLGPGINMKRSPLCGRNFEYYSEDPYLAGILASSYVNGVQQNGVGTSLKHFAANSQETKRMTSNSIIDERTLREIYLKAFEMVVKNSRPTTLMASYNRINGYYSCENKWLLKDVLRDDWGFDGVVVSDWGACTNLTKAAKAGMNLEMPDSRGIHKEQVLKDVEAGLITEEEIDEALKPLLELIEKYGMTDEEEAQFKMPSMEEYVARPETKSRHRLAVTAASEAAVLLKNDGVLPLKQNQKIAVIGDLAFTTRFQGGGSSHIRAAEYPNVVECMKKLFPNVKAARGYDAFSYDTDPVMEKDALDLCDEAEVVIYCGGLTDLAEGEGYDRSTFKMPENQVHLIRELVKKEKTIVFLSFGGAPFYMEGLSDWNAILQMYLGGEGVAEAAVLLLGGVKNPCGHLAETWPLSIEDTPAFTCFGKREKHILYKEGLFIGYRHYQSKKIPVQFPFGYGLSYTDFEYENMHVTREENGFRVSVDVTNVGNRVGKTVVQIYVKNPSADFPRPEKELKGFLKVSLNPGEMKEVEILIPDDAFRIYVPGSGWVTPAGEYEICIGKSVEETVLSEKIEVQGIKDLKLEEVKLEVPEEKEEFDITASFAELAEYSETAREIQKRAEEEIYRRYSDRSPEDAEVRMIIETFKDGTADSTALLGSDIDYGLVLKCIEEANQALAAAKEK